MLAEFVETLTRTLGQLVVVLGAPGITLVALFENLFPLFGRSLKIISVEDFDQRCPV